MPYKDPARKKEWERLHRPERLARRRELRQQDVGNIPVSEAKVPTLDGDSALLPIVGGLAGLGLAAYQPKLAIGSGGLTLLIAAILKKGSMWWILGTIVLALGIFFLWIERDERATPQSA
jgi:hypothetical protein